MDFAGQVGIVTGAGRGIGRGVALMYAQHGAQVVVADRNEADCQETARMIEETGGQALVQVTDVAKFGAVSDDVEERGANERSV